MTEEKRIKNGQQHTNDGSVRTVRLLSAFLSVVLLMMTLVSCGKIAKSNEKLIEERIDTFTTAYNSGDMETVLSCFNRKTRNTCQAMLNLAGGLVGEGTGLNIDLADLFALGVSMAPGDFMGLKIDEILVVEDEMRATAVTTMDLVGEGEQTVYFVMVYETDGWYIEDMTVQAVINSGQAETNLKTNVNVLKSKEVKDGFAVISEFQMNSRKYSGVLNAKGEVIYYLENKSEEIGLFKKSLFNWTSAGNGCGFVTLDPAAGKQDYSYIVFNSEGKQTLTVDGDVFDSIIGCGDGLLLVYKNTSTITSEEHSYGVMDCNGNWVTPLKAGSKLPDPSRSGIDEEIYEYIGEGAFILDDRSSWGRDILYNSYRNCAYAINDNYITKYPEEDVAERIYFPSRYIIHPDGTVETLPDTTVGHQDNLVWMNNGSAIQILDRETGVIREYTEYPPEMICNIYYDRDSESFTLIIEGADGKVYFTVIDKECNQKFDPIASWGRYYIYPGSNGRISYCGADGVYKVVDVDGNVVVPNTQGFTEIGRYSGGIAMAKKDNSYFFLDVDGQILDIRLPQ